MTGPSAPPPAEPSIGPPSTRSSIGPAGVPRPVTPRATWLLAPNPSPWTFDGTNSWVLHEPGHRGAVIVDPGPDHAGHLAALIGLAAEQGGTVTAILLTHGHSDHYGGIPETVRRTGAPVYAADRRYGDRVLGPGPLELSGLRIDVIATPGHSSDSLSFHLPDDQALVTGDTVLGRSAPGIFDPDGRVDQMISSLEQIKKLMATDAPVILPGHGPLVSDPAAQLALALNARAARLAQHEQAIHDGYRTVEEIADRLYGPFDERIRSAIEATVRAHLRYLHDHRGLGSLAEIDAP
jgi:glyoxylase-like metal-dependent hydrolase (beta-lactamase superfamily II)